MVNRFEDGIEVEFSVNPNIYPTELHIEMTLGEFKSQGAVSFERLSKGYPLNQLLWTMRSFLNRKFVEALEHKK